MIVMQASHPDFLLLILRGWQIVRCWYEGREIYYEMERGKNERK